MNVKQLNLGKICYLLVLLIFTVIFPVAASAGSITGNVIDSQTELPISG